MLQLGLLVFQRDLVFLQHAGLFFKLLIGGAQLFLLHLQFFVEVLGLAEYVFQPPAVKRGVDRVTDVAGGHGDQFHVTRGDGPQEAELHHTVDQTVVVHGDKQHVPGAALAQA